MIGSHLQGQALEVAFFVPNAWFSICKKGTESRDVSLGEDTDMSGAADNQLAFSYLIQRTALIALQLAEFGRGKTGNFLKLVGQVLYAAVA